jgi:hypothetical protein
MTEIPKKSLNKALGELKSAGFIELVERRNTTGKGVTDLVRIKMPKAKRSRARRATSVLETVLLAMEAEERAGVRGSGRATRNELRH